MNSSALSRILMLCISMVVAVLIVVNVLTAGGNVIGQMFKYLLPTFFIIGVLLPRYAIYIVFLCGGYLDVVKRLLTLEANFDQMDIALVMGLPLVTMSGMIISIVMPWLLGSRTPSRREILTVIIAIAAGLMLGGSYYTMGGGGLRGLGAAADASVYFFMFLIIPRYFTKSEDLIRFFKHLIIIYLLAAAWAIYQWKFGIFRFEMNYLLSGATIEARQLNERVFRNMGTMVAASALTIVASISFAALVIPFDFKTTRLNFNRYFTPLRVIGIPIYLVGAYVTFSRTGWVCGFAAIAVYILLRSRALAYPALICAICGLIALYGSAPYIYSQDIMNDLQNRLMDAYGTSEEIKQSLVLGTLNDRFESMKNFVTNGEIWSPLGLKISNSLHALDGVKIHDALTEALVQIGYIPLFILLASAFALYLKFLKINFSWEDCPERNIARYFVALGVGIFVSGLSAGKTAFVFPINAFWCFLFSGVVACRVIYHARIKQEANEAYEASLESNDASADPELLESHSS